MSVFAQLEGTAPPLSRSAERRMFSRLRLADGIFKTTVARRLGDVDAATVALLPSPARPVAVVDVGASSGTTSLELVEAIAAKGHRATLTLTDLSLTAKLVRLHRGYAVLLDRDGRLLQHLVGGLPVRPWRRRLDYLTQFWLVTAAANAWYRRAIAKDGIGTALAGAASILLVAPQAAAHPAITCEEGDVFAPAPAAHIARFDVVRAANLLLPDVFPVERIRVAIGQLKSRLRGPGALLVLARSPAPGRVGANRATIYRLEADGRLAVAARIGTGSDIEALVGT